MPVIEMKVPSPGESITEVQIARWIKKDGDGKRRGNYCSWYCSLFN